MGADKKTWSVAVLPGDGIGPEVVSEAYKVLKLIEAHCDEIRFDCRDYAVGATEYLKSGAALSDEVFEACRRSDAILLGAMGLPDVRSPDGRELSPQIDLREKLQLYSGIRPLYLFHENDTPLKNLKAGDIDLTIVRESTEGLFSSRSQDFDTSSNEVNDVLKVTRASTARLFHSAFKLALRQKNKLTLVDKANVLPSMVYFRSIFDEIAAQYPEVTTERVYVDAAALYLVRRPQDFDVMVTENMFGDILSDLGAGLVGGMGMAPSADIGPSAAVFQPAHGSAPDIAGKGVANPVAAILSTALMLEWFDDVKTRQAARILKAAVKQVLGHPENRTPDMKGKLTTRQLSQLIMDAMSALYQSEACNGVEAVSERFELSEN